MVGRPSRTFRHVAVGQTVTRIVPGEGTTQLRVTAVDRRLIHAGVLTFERDRGLEVDPVLGPSLWGHVQSRLEPEPRRVLRGADPRTVGMRRTLQILLFATYLIVLAGIIVAIGLRRDLLALALGAGLLLTWIAMKLGSPEHRAVAASAQQLRRPGGKA